jgi:predicted nucleotidyltransferase
MNTINLNTDEIANICQENDVAMLAVFGSVARGEATEQSDIDLLVRFSERKGLLALVRLERVFSETLGRKVDLLTEAAISPYIRDHILNDLQVLYGSR